MGILDREVDELVAEFPFEEQIARQISDPSPLELGEELKEAPHKRLGASALPPEVARGELTNTLTRAQI